MDMHAPLLPRHAELPLSDPSLLPEVSRESYLELAELLESAPPSLLYHGNELANKRRVALGFARNVLMIAKITALRRLFARLDQLEQDAIVQPLRALRIAHQMSTWDEPENRRVFTSDEAYSRFLTTGMETFAQVDNVLKEIKLICGNLQEEHQRNLRARTELIAARTFKTCFWVFFICNVAWVCFVVYTVLYASAHKRGDI
ncbi:hypothetical protein Micbo1qcDRAFT_180630 [Microdochium bolleyi]|uniref:Transmembrane protein n=1 Tax=Microdochium bolleyi TaxID=196109 RepID=A0A136IL12_9PEZI|nr:hypothetical protein Micbo1qcDRAFT_180630 [Microdochium bolleyi]